MFESVELKEFGGVRSCEKPIKLYRFTALIGPNNSSKTTLLSALFLFPHHETDYYLPVIDMYKPSFLSEFLHRSPESFVYRYSGHGQIDCVLRGKMLRLEVSAERGLPGKIYYVKDNANVPMDTRALMQLFEFKEPSSLTGYTLFIPSSDIFREKLDDVLVKRWRAVEKTGAHLTLVRELISKVVEDKFTEVSVRYNNLILRKELPGDVASIEVRHVGDGVRRFLTSALWLETVKPQVVLWDDLESAAHPSLIREIIEWLAVHEWQVIISTHSIDVLHELILAEPKDAMVVALRKQPGDSLTYKEYKLEELEQLFESGQDVRKLLV